MIKKLAFYDFDGTLADSPLPEQGKEEWSKVYGKPYPHIGWWGRVESLDIKVFEIELFDTTEKLARQDISDPETLAFILTSRMEKLRPALEAVLDYHGIRFDYVDMKSGGETKGQKILNYISKYPDVVRVDVYDDNYEREIVDFKSIRSQIPSHIQFNIFHADNGQFTLIKETYNIQNIIQEEIEKLL